MKSVLPRLAEFGDELSTGGEGAAPSQRGQGHASYKRPSNRPPAPHKAPHSHWPLAETQTDVDLPCTINLTCTGMRENATTAYHEEEQPAQEIFRANAEARENLRLLQMLWEGQKHPNIDHKSELDSFTLVGKGAVGTQDQPTVVKVEGVPEEVLVDWTTEWKAVPWTLPQLRESPAQLACLLFCKGVSKTELPRVNIADWKPGSVGIPTFHCKRCFRNWFRSGGTLTDLECNEPEDIMEGPAMCITFSDQTSSKMIVSRIIGKDGKPVRITVKNPEAFLTKKKGRSSQRGSATGEKKRGKKRGAQRGVGDSYLSNVSSECESDSEGDEDELDLPEDIRKYILKCERKRRKESRPRQTDGVGSYSSSTYSLSSDVEDGGNSDNNGKHKKTRGEKGDRKKRRKEQRRRRRELEATGGTEAGVLSSNSCYLFSSFSEDDTIVDEDGKHKRKSKNRERRRKRQECEDVESLGSGKVYSTFSDSSDDILEQRNKLRNKAGKSGASSKTGGQKVSRRQHRQGKGLRSDDMGEDDACVRSDYDSGNSSTHLPPISGDGAHHKRRRREKKSPPQGLDSGEHLPDIGGGKDRGFSTHRNRRSFRSGERETEGEGQVQLPRIAESSHSGSDGYSGRSSLYHSMKDDQDGGLLKQDMNWSSSGKARGRGKGANISDARRDNQHNPVTGRRGSTMNSTQLQESANSQLSHQKTHPKGSSRTGEVEKKTATIQEDVPVPVKQTGGALKKPKRKQAPKKTPKESKGQVRASSPRELPAHDVVLLPTEGDQVPAHDAVGLQRLPAQDNDNHPKRIGRKIVKKTRKPPEPQRPTVMHNSKDLGDTIKNHVGTENQTVGEDSGGYRGSTLSTLKEEQDQELLAQKGQSGEGLHRVLSSVGGRGAGGVQMGRKKSNAAGLPLQSRVSLKAVAGAGRNAMGYNSGSSELLSSGLGARELDIDTRRQSLAPVSLKPIMEPSDGASGSITVRDRNVQLQMKEGNTQDNHTQDNAPVSNPADPIPIPGSSSEIVIEEEVVEEEEEDESGGEEPLFPVYDLRELSGLCFTSPFSFSLFPMATQYQEVYDTVRRRSLQPVSLARPNQRKLIKGRK